MLLRITGLIPESWEPASPEGRLSALPSHWTFYFVVPSLWRTVSASFGTCPIKFTGDPASRAATRRRLPVAANTARHAASCFGAKKVKVRLASHSSVVGAGRERGRCFWLYVATWKERLLRSAGVWSGMSPVLCASRWWWGWCWCWCRWCWWCQRPAAGQ